MTLEKMTDWSETPAHSSFKFKPGLMHVCGTVGSGKTEFALNLIRNASTCFQNPPKTVHYYYEKWQDAYEKYPAVHFYSGLSPDLEPPPNSLVILDDVGDFAMRRKYICRIASVHGRHSNIYLACISHNLFSKDRYAVDMNVCSQYLILFENVRYTSQIQTFARQMLPDKIGYFMNAYRKACNRMGYLCVDLTPRIEDRLLSDVFNRTEGILIYREYK